jgi:hypothetical protein
MARRVPVAALGMLCLFLATCAVRAAAVYADAFLFPEGAGQAPGRFDTRVRIAADLYNWALLPCS